jgi:prephenate dehydrogenase
MIPGKHGGAARNYTFLPVVIEDKPGQLAALFDECAIAQVNVEDLSIEHSPEQFTGLITLALSKNDAEKLHQHLLNKGWRAHAPR